MACRNCGWAETHVRQVAGPNHVLHLILSILSCGLWLIPWLVIALSDSGKRSVVICSRCGRAVA
jgi:hypothetical protein